MLFTTFAMTRSRNRRRWLLLGMLLLMLATASALAYTWQRQAEPEPAPTLQPTFTPAPPSAAVTPAANARSALSPSLVPGQAGAPLPGTSGAARPTQPGDLVQPVANDAETFNPLFALDPMSLAVVDKLYPRLLGQDPRSGFIIPTELAQTWEISDDGRVYTFRLRQNVLWSDGTPVTAEDFRFTYSALASEATQSPYRDRAANVERIDVPDPYTLVVTTRTPDCAVLHSLRHPLLPAARFAADFSDLATNPLNRAPTVSAGPFRFVERRPGIEIVLARNPNYWKGSPRIQRWILRVVPEAGERWSLLASGEADLTYIDADRLARLDPAAAQAAGIVVAPIVDAAYTFLALNLADPASPQPGESDAVAILPQTPHPILGDLEVRRAIAEAIDYDAILADLYGAQASTVGFRPAGYVLPTVAWAADPSLLPPTFALDSARARLDAAGWIDSDGDGVREKDGRPLSLSLTTNQENPRRVRIAQLVQANLEAAGFRIGYAPAPYVDAASLLLGQRFDLVLIGWDNLSADPGLSRFWHTRDDLPGAGYNFTSFHDTEVDAWLDEAARMPGCNLDGRGERYRQVQRRVAEQFPYILLSGERAAWAYSAQWRGIAPNAWGLEYNAHEWQK